MSHFFVNMNLYIPSRWHNGCTIRLEIRATWVRFPGSEHYLGHLVMGSSLKAISPLPLIQVGQMSVTGDEMCYCWYTVWYSQRVIIRWVIHVFVVFGCLFCMVADLCHVVFSSGAPPRKARKHDKSAICRSFAFSPGGAKGRNYDRLGRKHAT